MIAVSVFSSLSPEVLYCMLIDYLSTVRDQVIFFWTLVARVLSRKFDTYPHLRPAPTPLPDSFQSAGLQLVLSQKQQDQISDIFELFDTDGGGSIDRTELEFAMTALGFHGQNKHASNLLNTIAGDGRVTLAEFSSLMTGEVLGSNQFEDVQSVFAVLCEPDGESKHNNLITLHKLQDACFKFEVCSLPQPNCYVVQRTNCFVRISIYNFILTTNCDVDSLLSDKIYDI